MKQLLKYTMLLAFNSLAIFYAFAQKVDLDPFHFTFQFRDLPHSPVDTSYTSYSVLVDAASGIRRSKSVEAISNAVRLYGFEKVETDGDIRIDLSFNDLIIDGYEITENVSESKNKDGTVKKTYSYYIVVTYTITGGADFMDKKNNLLKKHMALGVKGSKWTSSKFDTRSAARSYYDDNRSSIISSLVREKVDAAVVELNNYINYHFGFPTENYNLFLWLIDSKKHPEYEGMKKRWEALKPVLQSVTASSFTNEDKEIAREMIKYFDELKTKYAKDEKSDKKIRYAAWFNNAWLYLLIDEPENAMKEADGLVANDYDPKDGKKLRERAEEQSALMLLNFTKTRHFDLENE